MGHLKALLFAPAFPKRKANPNNHASVPAFQMSMNVLPHLCHEVAKHIIGEHITCFPAHQEDGMRCRVNQAPLHHCP
ncbi:hypothetical protein GOP47_0029819 [Adiantum capillus-veneris]|nr:hypothetical protein GOP47_0029819 [Adiantum capillus-veneris]